MVKYLKHFDFRKRNTTIKIESTIYNFRPDNDIQSTIYNFRPDNENAFITRMLPLMQHFIQLHIVLLMEV